MKLYEIDNEIEKILYLCSESDGVLNEDLETRLDALEVAKEIKVLNTALAYKNEEAFLVALKGEKKNIEARIKASEKRFDFQTYYLNRHAKGMGLKSEKVQIKWRKSDGLKITGEVDPHYMNPVKEATPNKKAIKAAIKGGAEIDFAEIEERQNLNIT